MLCILLRLNFRKGGALNKGGGRFGVMHGRRNNMQSCVQQHVHCHLSSPCLCCTFHALDASYTLCADVEVSLLHKENKAWLHVRRTRLKFKCWFGIMFRGKKKQQFKKCPDQVTCTRKKTCAHLWPVQGQPLGGAAVVAAGLGERRPQGRAGRVVEDLLLRRRNPPLAQDLARP